MAAMQAQLGVAHSTLALRRGQSKISLRELGCPQTSQIPVAPAGLCAAWNGDLASKQARLFQHREVGKRQSKRFSINAVAVPLAPVKPLTSPAPYRDLSDPAERARVAEASGFRQVGEPLPSNVTLKQVIDSLPPEVFELDDVKAWKSVLISVASFGLGLTMCNFAPWYLLPFAWAFTGTAFTGWFVVGHDCAHKSFSKNKLLEDIVGTIMFMPLIYPYEPWRIKHDRHHAKTNMLVGDTAWHPVMKNEYEEGGTALQTGLQLGMGPLRFLASIGHWLVYHFDLKKYRASEQTRVKVSLAAVFAFMAIGWPLIIANFGVAGWFKLWLMPWLGYHFWMSTFTMVHHTAPHIPFKPANEWNAAQAQLGGTVHCDYPSWVEALCHDINVHVPHHVSQKIPSYNLRAATDSLRENWGKYMTEASWNWRLMKTIFTECHFYDEERNYAAFDDGLEKESPILAPLRKLMPNKI